MLGAGQYGNTSRGALQFLRDKFGGLSPAMIGAVQNMFYGSQQGRGGYPITVGVPGSAGNIYSNYADPSTLSSIISLIGMPNPQQDIERYYRQPEPDRSMGKWAQYDQNALDKMIAYYDEVARTAGPPIPVNPVYSGGPGNYGPLPGGGGVRAPRYASDYEAGMLPRNF